MGTKVSIVKSNVYLIFLLIFLISPKESRAQGFPPEPGLFNGLGAGHQGNLIVLGSGIGSEQKSYLGKLGYQIDEYQLSFSNQNYELNYANFPKSLVQTNLSIGKMTFLDSGHLLMVNLGIGVSGEQNSDTYNYVQPTGQVMYMIPPDPSTHWGYGLGMMYMPNSPIGTFPIPMLMAIYSPSEDFQLNLGLPMISARITVWQDGKLSAIVAPFGIQRVALQQSISENLNMSAVYKQDRNFFGHIHGWESSQLFNYEVTKAGFETEYKISKKTAFGLEGGYLVKRNFQKVQSGFSLNTSPLSESSIAGGCYGQLILSYGF